jgi:hypothetical protein
MLHQTQPGPSYPQLASNHLLPDDAPNSISFIPLFIPFLHSDPHWHDPPNCYVKFNLSMQYTYTITLVPAQPTL